MAVASISSSASVRGRTHSSERESAGKRTRFDSASLLLDRDPSDDLLERRSDVSDCYRDPQVRLPIGKDDDGFVEDVFDEDEEVFRK